MSSPKSITLAFALAAALGGLAPSADANQINSGGAAGAYHASFCPALSAQLSFLSEVR